MKFTSTFVFYTVLVKRSSMQPSEIMIDYIKLLYNFRKKKW